MTKHELRELDVWLYRNVPGLKTCNCVNWIQLKFGQAEYEKIRRTFLAQGSKDRWPEIEPDLPCSHQQQYHSDPADAMQVLEKCINEQRRLNVGDSSFFISKDGSDFWLRTVSKGKHIEGIAPTLELAILLFAKNLFREP